MSGVLQAGLDYATNAVHPISVDSQGKLDIDVQVDDLIMKANDGNDGAGTDRTVKCSAQGELEVRCLGLDAGGNQVQLKTEADGSLHVITENADSVLIKGIESGTTTQRDCKQNANGDLRVQLIANDGNDGAGTMRIVKCDANGVLDTAGGGGGSADSTAANQVLQLAQETIAATQTTATATSVASMDGKIVACDTSGLAAETTLAAAEVHLGTIDTNIASVDGKIVACDTSGLATETTLAAAEVHLGTIDTNIASVDGKITACNTGAVVVSSSALPTGAATEATASAANANLGNIAAAVSGTEFQCDILTSALPTGAATSALQTAGNADLSSLAGCVSGTELQVDIVSGGGGGTQFAGGATLAATGVGTAMIGKDVGNVARLVATDTVGNLQMNILTNVDTTKATSTLQTAGNASLTSIDASCSSIQSTVAQSTNQLLTFKSDIVVAASTAVADGATANGDLDLGTSLKIGGSPKEIYIETTMSPAVNATISVLYSVDNTNFTAGLSFAPESIFSTYNLTPMTTMTSSGSVEFEPPRYLRFQFQNNDGFGTSTDIKMTCHYVG